MVRIVCSLILGAAIGASALTAAAPARAESEGARLDGTWMAIGDLLGLLPGNIEVMTIDGNRASNVYWRMGISDCAAEPAALGCALPIPLSEGQLSANSFELGVLPDGEPAVPYDAADPAAGVWPLYTMTGAPWQAFRQGERLMTVREATIEGTAVPLMRIWIRVPAALPEQLFDFLIANDLGVSHSICPVVTLFGDPAAWAGFSAHLAAMAAPNHDLQLWRSGHAAPAAVEALAAGDASAYGPEAAAAYALNHGWQRGSGTLPEGTVLWQGFPWPVPAAMAPVIEDCDARLFGN